ncbi:MAG: Rieske 2Fe-2S protein [Chitinophagaceae bacterium]|jgi:nitrite reductase/ring-hydroxylating ferredoxin subunit/uncharacterized membrane protein|nr:Rieske 2Fe-2S protein [Chitinophagaceae bacterium]
MLIAFPVAFLSGTFIFDALAVLLDNEQLWQTAYYLGIAGVGSALIAAVPGVIDFIFTVPPKSSAKKRGALHGIVNLTHVTLFFVAWRMRQDPEASRSWILAIEGVAVLLLAFAGWLGGTLVYRNQIGVDPRYANAGKWNEAYLQEATGAIEVAKSSELKVNQMKLVHIGSKRIVIGRTEEGFVGFDDHCTHRGGSLAGGMMICGTVQCPWHGSQFDVRTGEVKCGPARKKIQHYTVTEKAGKVYLEL